jgi:hypothetical protein
VEVAELTAAAVLVVLELAQELQVAVLRRSLLLLLRLESTTQSQSAVVALLAQA